MFIAGEPSFLSGCRYRILNIASALPAQSFETVVVGADELGARLGELDRADVLWIWRSSYGETLASAINRARAAGARVVCDIDDLVFRPELARPDVVDGLRTKNIDPHDLASHFANVRTTLLEGDHGTASTAPLARALECLGLPATVVPNGFDEDFLRVAEQARSTRPIAVHSVVRVGYAAGTFTHQRDLAVAVPAIARLLEDHPSVRFVTTEAVDLGEFPELASRAPQLEVRPLVPYDRLPFEYARFDVSIAPLEIGNPFCEAKSEIKYMEAALAGVPTVASPTEPFATAIRDGDTGFLSGDSDSWLEVLSLLVGDARLRDEVAKSARADVLARFGPVRRGRVVTELFERLLAGDAGRRSADERPDMR